MTALEYIEHLQSKLNEAGISYTPALRFDDDAVLIDKLRDKIEQLTRENEGLSIKVWNYEQPARTPLYSSESMVNCNFVICYKENAELKAQNAELQKQVDELTKQKQTLIKVCDNCPKVITDVEQAVKDTAKEILQRGKYCMPSGLREWIEEHYSVEVE